MSCRNLHRNSLSSQLRAHLHIAPVKLQKARQKQLPVLDLIKQRALVKTPEK